MSLLDRLATLAPKVPRPGLRVDGSPVADGLDWEEVAGALAQVDGPSRDLLRGMYLGDARSMRTALARLQGVAMGRSAESDDGRYGPTALVALQAFCAQGQCPTCEGRKFLMDGELRVVCQRCDGSGVAQPPLPAMLRAVDLEPTDMRLALVDQLMEVLALWHSDGWRALGIQLRDGT